MNEWVGGWVGGWEEAYLGFAREGERAFSIQPWGERRVGGWGGEEGGGGGEAAAH